MKVISLTGGVGSGKSRILQYMKEQYQACIIQADQVAKNLMLPEQPGYSLLVHHFGDRLLDEQGRLDREKLSSVLFGDRDIRNRINSLIHPLVWQQIRDLLVHCKSPVAVVEAALFDPDCFSMFDCRWYVYVTEEQRIIRLMENRGYSEIRCRQIMDSQPTEAQFRSACQVVIDNNGDFEQTIRQVRQLLEKEMKECD